MTDTVLVRPRMGLILDGIPRAGAEIPAALAEEWIADRMVERVPAAELPSPPTVEPRPARKPAKDVVNATRKRRRTR